MSNINDQTRRAEGVTGNAESNVITDLNQQNEQGPHVSHTTGESKAPTKAEESLQGSGNRTASEPGQSTSKTHAKEGGKASIVPQKIQEKLPESIERAVPNAIHDTGDEGGLHRKQSL